MVGLSILLEAQKASSINHNNNNKKNPQVINKTTMIINNNNNNNNKPSSSSSSSSSSSKRVSQSSSYPVPPFLEHCFLCKQKLLPGKDIYMYKGDKGFCSVECRCRQIIMDEEESLVSKKENCSFAAMKPTSAPSSAASSSSSSSASGSRHRNKGTRNRTGGFAY